MGKELTMCCRCLYWEPVGGEASVASLGVCVRHAPRPQPAFLYKVRDYWKWAISGVPGVDHHNYRAVWPITEARHQCGEGERRKGKEG
jgi:hypothetical protein